MTLYILVVFILYFDFLQFIVVSCTCGDPRIRNIYTLDVSISITVNDQTAALLSRAAKLVKQKPDNGKFQ